MYQVLARKWRPRGLDDLIGQPHVARTLRNAIEGSRFAHAYLFAGLRGTGKTTVARILAKCLNCERGPTSRPCDQCTSCIEIAESRSLDVLEVDAASRTGVDDIRELQEVVSYAPVRDRYRVLIIDEAHMLSKAAFNALLKTLEEPPPQVVFVLATTELQKVLPTILSRCQVFEFRRVPAREVAAHLRRVCDDEGVRISDRALERVALAGEGSVRDSLSVLERILAFCGRDVTDEDALQILGSVRTDVIARLVRAMAARDASDLLAGLDAVVEDGHDLMSFWGELIAVVRDLLLATQVPNRPEMISRSAEDFGTLAAAAADLSPADLIRIFQILADLEPGLKASSQPRFLFEAALVRIASLGLVRPIEEILATLGGAPSETPARSTPPPSRARPAPPRTDASPSPGIATTLQDAAHERRPALGPMLDVLRQVEIAGETAVLSFPQVPDFFRRTLEREDSLEFLRDVVSEAVGRKIAVRLAFDPAGAKPQPQGPSPSPAPASSSSRRPAPDPPRGDFAERVRKEPAVQKVLREFGAQVVDVRPLEKAEEPSVGPDAPSTPSEEGS